MGICFVVHFGEERGGICCVGEKWESALLRNFGKERGGNLMCCVGEKWESVLLCILGRREVGISSVV